MAQEHAFRRRNLHDESTMADEEGAGKYCAEIDLWQLFKLSEFLAVERPFNSLLSPSMWNSG